MFTAKENEKYIVRSFSSEELEQDSIFMDKLTAFIRNEIVDGETLFSDNYSLENWRDNPASFFYQLFISKKYKKNNGRFFFLLTNEAIIAFSGIYKSEFEKKIAIAGSRAWTSLQCRDVRKLQNKYLLPAQEKWARENEVEELIITFNIENKRLFDYVARSVDKITSGFYYQMEPLDQLVYINFTLQHIIKKKLNVSFYFDYTKLSPGT